MNTLLHFTSSWAARIWEPHRSEVAAAARRLGATVREVDVDQEGDLVRHYGVLNVPAVAIHGNPSTLLVGALPADDLVERLTAG